MIFIKLKGHDFRYETENIIKQFDLNDKITFVENNSPVNSRGIFLSSGIYRSTGRYRFVSSLGNGTGTFIIAVKSLKTGNLTEDTLRRTLKREVSRQVYNLFSRYTGKKLPWGFLTGIRPAKIVHEMLENSMHEHNIIQRLTGYFKLSGQKAQLVYDVASVERKILNRTPDNTVSIYIGIPFCPTRCLYCSFASYPIKACSGFVENYLVSLKKEISTVYDELIKGKGYKIQSLYIGGGTPTALNNTQLKGLLDFIMDNLDLTDLEEYTIEAGRPDSLDAEKLETIKNSKVSRISINPQTMNSDTLEFIGRRHTPLETLSAFEIARSIGFDNINMDIIAGLPGEDIEKFKRTLDIISKLGPESLTVHTLAVKRGSRLHEEKGTMALPTSETATQMVNLAGNYAGMMNMHPYYLYRQKYILGNLENIGYCKRGYEGLYNIQIMEEKQTNIAFGADAVTKVVYSDENRIERAFNVKNVEEYIKRVDEMIDRKRRLLG
ncbi:MAG: coproporphyrinogen dehydrogenase HemZ [Bacillota bacterium]|nr:coproporphyrinogen dehydrogenase HemZ [Bacillota bacterium]